MESMFRKIKFTDADVVNWGDFIPAGEYNPHNVRPWLLHDHGFTICVVFASNLQDALDEAVDCDKLDAWQIHPENESDRDDYMTASPKLHPAPDGFDDTLDNPDYVLKDGSKWWWKGGCEPTCLGNASEPFDIEGLDAVELPNPPPSFCALFDAMQAEVKS